ncbi:hypothetical protein RB967 [Rhodopirellula baltica SH 1]|uniref:Uncharacterized protein n=1 Tax=Rhodopirellula baltica (strain DSM 10527 / NCIMB 13988 / SH1) TaxID=243090 RepID=Q7UY03_RHOBA|nr:hypothetical protein RB967 [Rhodopirellula baltica SH 1]
MFEQSERRSSGSKPTQPSRPYQGPTGRSYGNGTSPTKGNFILPELHCVPVRPTTAINGTNQSAFHLITAP